MSTQGNPQPSGTPTGRHVRRAGLTIGIGLVVGVIIVVFLGWLSFVTRAQGIAEGYLQAATSAYQMGRPIPDTIFETGPYRIQATTMPQADGGSALITVTARDRFINHPFYEISRPVAGAKSR